MHTTSICICGGGNAAHVLLGLLGSQTDVRVRLFDTLPDEVQRFQRALDETGGTVRVHFKDGRDDLIGGVERISTKAEEVIPGSDLIILAVPAFAHELYFEQIARHAQPDCAVGVMVAKGGVDWQFREIFKDRLNSTEFFAMENLPWACRIRDYGRSAEILSTKLSLDIGVYSRTPQRLVEHVSQLISLGSGDDAAEKLPQFKLAPNFISCSLRGNLGHACIMYGRFHDWDGLTPFKEVPLFYEGVDQFTAEVMEQASLEVMEIKRALVEQLGLDLSSVIEAKEWLIKVYGDEIADKSTLQSVITTNRGYEGLQHAMDQVDEGYVPSPHSRYLTEDIPFGILVIRGIADTVGVATPVIDRVIEWNQRFMGKEYLVEGQLTGKDVPSTRVPQRYGITHAEHLVA